MRVVNIFESLNFQKKNLKPKLVCVYAQREAATESVFPVVVLCATTNDV